MKRFILFLMCVLMVFTATACKNDNETVNEVPTLVWYVHGDKQPDIASVMEEVNKTTIEKIGAKVDLQFIDQPAYSEKMNMMMASQTEFDL